MNPIYNFISNFDYVYAVICVNFNIFVNKSGTKLNVRVLLSIL